MPESLRVYWDSSRRKILAHQTLPGTFQVATPMPFRFSLISEGTDEIMQDILYKEEKVR